MITFQSDSKLILCKCRETASHCDVRCKKKNVNGRQRRTAEKVLSKMLHVRVPSGSDHNGCYLERANQRSSQSSRGTRRKGWTEASDWLRQTLEGNRLKCAFLEFPSFKLDIVHCIFTVPRTHGWCCSFVDSRTRIWGKKKKGE